MDANTLRDKLDGAFSDLVVAVVRLGDTSPAGRVATARAALEVLEAARRAVSAFDDYGLARDLQHRTFMGHVVGPVFEARGQLSHPLTEAPRPRPSVN